MLMIIGHIFYPRVTDYRKTIYVERRVKTLIKVSRLALFDTTHGVNRNFQKFRSQSRYSSSCWHADIVFGLHTNYNKQAMAAGVEYCVVNGKNHHPVLRTNRVDVCSIEPCLDRWMDSRSNSTQRTGTMWVLCSMWYHRSIDFVSFFIFSPLV